MKTHVARAHTEVAKSISSHRYHEYVAIYNKWKAR